MASVKTVRRGILILAGNIAVLAILILLLEGGSSLILFLRDASKTIPLAESLHTTYDAELGWVNEAGVIRPDMYGPGITLTTNARGFRGQQPTDSVVPQGKIRVICSGDSFTLGYGVRDDETWCHRLMRLNDRLETVNMGQGGYGFDQAYLWYRRDGVRLAHHVQVLAFISDDFRRMERDEFSGYAKPVLRVDGDSLRVDNVPVPRSGYGVASWFTRNAEPLGELRVVQFITRLRSRGREAPAAPSQVESQAQTESTRRVVAKLLHDLKLLHDSRNSRLVLVLLPTRYELNGRAPDEWTAFLAAQAAALGVTYVDLFPLFREIPEQERATLFLRAGQLSYPGAAGHYTRAGNAHVAEAVHRVLLTELWPAGEN